LNSHIHILFSLIFHTAAHVQFIQRELKETVIAVVWGGVDPDDWTKLKNLVRIGEKLKVDPNEVQAGR
jgi:hypothetical protein